MIWITGDTHRDFDWLEQFCQEMKTTKDDVMIILGDAGINFYGPSRDDPRKRWLAQMPITLLCIHGNHEMRPENLYTYELVPWRDGVVWQEPLFPSLLFARDGEVYDLDGVPSLVIGGAYSVDKMQRIAWGEGWWPDEQPDAATRARVEAALDKRDWQIGAILSHTCPLRCEPVEMFLSNIDQSRVDKTTEEWLNTLEEKATYRRWFCGHFHTDKEYETHDDGRRICFMFLNVRAWNEANGLAEGERWQREASWR